MGVLKDTASSIAGFAGMCRRTVGTLGFAALSAATTLAPVASLFGQNKKDSAATALATTGQTPLQSATRLPLPDIVAQKRQASGQPHGPAFPMATHNIAQMHDVVLNNQNLNAMPVPKPSPNNFQNQSVTLPNNQLPQNNPGPQNSPAPQTNSASTSAPALPPGAYRDALGFVIIPFDSQSPLQKKAENQSAETSGILEKNTKNRRYYMAYARYAPQGREIPDGKHGNGGVHLGIEGYYDFLPKHPDLLGIGANWDIMLNSPQTIGGSYSGSTAYQHYGGSASWTPATGTLFLQSGYNFLNNPDAEASWILEPYVKGGAHFNPLYNSNLLNFGNGFVGAGLQFGAQKNNGTGFLIEAEFGKRFYNPNYQFFPESKGVLNYGFIKVGYTRSLDDLRKAAKAVKGAFKGKTSYIDPADMLPPNGMDQITPGAPAPVKMVDNAAMMASNSAQIMDEYNISGADSTASVLAEKPDQPAQNSDGYVCAPLKNSNALTNG